MQELDRTLKKISFVRRGMFVPLRMTEEMIDKVGAPKDASIFVMFSYEMIPVLREMGYDNLYLYVDKIKPHVHGLCNKYNVKLVEALEDLDMKFDVVIGNPPYQNSANAAKNNKLWKTFTDKAVELQPNVIAFVTPNSAFKDVDSNGKRVRATMSKNNYGLVDFVNHRNSVFIGVGVETCHWIISKVATTPIDDGVFSNNDSILQSIIDKVVSYEDKLPIKSANGQITRGELSDDFEHEIYFSGSKMSKTNTTPTGAGELKLILPFSASYKNMFVSDKPCGALNQYLPVETVEESEFIIGYLKHPLMVLVANTYKRTSGFTPFVKNRMLPDLRKKDLSDIYNIFELTEEEIEYVEQNC